LCGGLTILMEKKRTQRVSGEGRVGPREETTLFRGKGEEMKGRNLTAREGNIERGNPF